MTMCEMIFLPIANHLPRLMAMDLIRYIFYKLAGVHIEGRCIIYGPLTIRPVGGTKNITIGKGSFLNTEIRFGCPKDRITIGKNCQIGPRVCFETMSHGMVYEPGKGRGRLSKPIVVDDEVWIGCGAIILQGVTIGKGAVVSAGAVVSKDVEPLTVVGGVPAKLLKKIDVNDTQQTLES
jgi:acetyltransferase-like isoleucine patch superfamily enzyme